MKKVRIVLTLDEEDWDNLFVAIGYALGSLQHSPSENKQMTARVSRRLRALSVALQAADVTELVP